MNCKGLDPIFFRCGVSAEACQVKADPAVFGADDSCPGTPKYLEVHYKCVKYPDWTTSGVSSQTTSGSSSGKA